MTNLKNCKPVARSHFIGASCRHHAEAMLILWKRQDLDGHLGKKLYDYHKLLGQLHTVKILKFGTPQTIAIIVLK